MKEGRQMKDEGRGRKIKKGKKRKGGRKADETR
jgi:hypothetical protein